ncbi:U3-containing 90S pre-ribosomal complex subunit-domain containing protein [Zychaea mexicana]|uniref:U3-containing 90S pre-ribosomal complex subunit-domain containing protein n=1 Tax=Zychaea mexicana TaxID=64656 RepID=UPI0022FEAC8B|nr:U3-containing 90S pre-ribosomal complex subunit-domain containing protein [Zychaea mexicana]KAI9496055.1 U3-containing 90S pre-ribosomal complex subunit-domain containing protein [Zychaea mexicana]
MSDRPISGDALEDDFYLEGSVESDNEGPTVGSKRKVEDEDEDDSNTTQQQQEQEKKKKNKQKKKRKVNDPFRSLDHVYKADRETQFQYVQDRQRSALPNLTQVELEEQILPEDQFVNNAQFKQPEHTLDTLPNYIKFGMLHHKKLDKKPQDPAAPTVLVLTHAAMRAADLARAMKPLGKVAKLFAKHMKVKEQAEFLQKDPVHLGVGTPNRIKALVEQEHLNLDNLELIVVDTERNAKRFTAFENDAVRNDLYSFLGAYIAPRMNEKKTRLGLF